MVNKTNVSLEPSSNSQHTLQPANKTLTKENQVAYEVLKSSTEIKAEKKPFTQKINTLSVSNQSYQITTDRIPSRFNYSLSKSYVSAIKSKVQQQNDMILKDSHNLTLRCTFSHACLLLSQIYQHFKETATLPHKIQEHTISQMKYLEKAKWENQQARNLDPLNARPYYNESLIMEYEGVDCKNIPDVEKYVYLLKLALAFDPQLEEAQQTLDKTINFLRTRWQELENEGKIDTITYQEWISKLKQSQNQDPLKTLFENRPALFILASAKYKDFTKYKKFFDQHPELKSIEAFIKLYPETGTIKLNTLSKEHMHEALSQAKENPLARKLVIISSESILNPDLAHEIKEAMLDFYEKKKLLKVYIGNRTDINTLMESFLADKRVNAQQDALKGQEIRLENVNFPVYVLNFSKTSSLSRTG